MTRQKLGNPLIIPYQEINGNYNKRWKRNSTTPIIPYQEINGNYNVSNFKAAAVLIIPYQEINGNYNLYKNGERRV